MAARSPGACRAALYLSPREGSGAGGSSGASRRRRGRSGCGHGGRARRGASTSGTGRAPQPAGGCPGAPPSPRRLPLQPLGADYENGAVPLLPPPVAEAAHGVEREERAKKFDGKAPPTPLLKSPRRLLAIPEHSPPPVSQVGKT